MAYYCFAHRISSLHFYFLHFIFAINTFTQTTFGNYLCYDDKYGTISEKITHTALKTVIKLWYVYINQDDTFCSNFHD